MKPKRVDVPHERATICAGDTIYLHGYKDACTFNGAIARKVYKTPRIVIAVPPDAEGIQELKFAVPGTSIDLSASRRIVFAKLIDW